MLKTEKSEIDAQVLFCNELMKRLSDRVLSASKSGAYGIIEGHTQMQTDARRIRRELMTLINLLDPYKE